MTRRNQLLFSLPALGLVGLFVLLPSARTFIDSFFAGHDRAPFFVGTRYYEYALTDPKLHLALKNNWVYFLWTLLFEVGAGLALALGLERQSRWNHFLRLTFFSPAVLSMAIIGLVFGFLFKEGIGLFPAIWTEKSALVLISIVSGWAYAGLFMMIFLAALAAIPTEILEAAFLDGAGRWAVFWRIKLPLLGPVMGVSFFICFTGAFKAFDLFWVLAPNQESTSIVSTVLIKEVFQFGDRGYGAAIAVLMSVLVLLGSLAGGALQRQFRSARAAIT